MEDYTDARRKLRFESYLTIVPETGCWEWNAHRYPSGYGQFWWGPNTEGHCQTVKASRAAWRIYRGKIEKDGNVLHKCNNRPCCNPDHLYIGTHLDNARDRDAAGRTSRWDKRYNFKRSDELLSKIKALLPTGKSLEVIRKELNVGWQTIYRAKDQDEELRRMIKETKTLRYSKPKPRRST